MKRFNLAIGSILAAATLFLAAAPLARAEDPKCAEGKGGYTIVRGADGKKVFKLTCGLVVHAKPPKPSVIYVLNASTINYEWEGLKKDFLQNTLHSVEQAPF